MTNQELPKKPDLTYKPPIGGNRDMGRVISTAQIRNSYADLKSLKENLTKLFQNCEFLISQFQRDLIPLALEITDESYDSDLKDAHETIWTQNTQQPINLVTYPYYSLLNSLDTSPARFIQRRYESAAQDVNGDNALELMQLTNVIQREGMLVDDFIDQYIANLDDSSEHRVVELFQDWTSAALAHTQTLLNIHKKKNAAAKFQQEDIKDIQPGEASNTQALFKVKLNSLNEEINSEMSILKRNFSEYSDIFYDKFMGPLLKTRLAVTRTMYPRGGMIGAEVQTIKAVTENHLDSVLTDQLRRHKIFDDKFNSITNLIKKRDTYRHYIKQLAPVGKRPRNNGPGVLVNIKDPNEFPFQPLYDQIITKSKNTKSKFKADHLELANRESPEAHPQYLLRDGGEIVGDISFAGKAKIGGMHLPSHSHTGIDGSAKISGRDLLPGSLQVDAIDTSLAPKAPKNVVVVRQTAQSVTDGVDFWSAQLEFEGDEDSQYEIQIAVIE